MEKLNRRSFLTMASVASLPLANIPVGAEHATIVDLNPAKRYLVLLDRKWVCDATAIGIGECLDGLDARMVFVEDLDAVGIYELGDSEQLPHEPR